MEIQYTFLKITFILHIMEIVLLHCRTVLKWRMLWSKAMQQRQKQVNKNFKCIAVQPKLLQLIQWLNSNSKV